MITAAGRKQILRKFANIVPSIADTMMVGVSPKAENANDFRLDHEFARVDITSTNIDVNTGKVIFKATLPPEMVGTIHEVAIASQSRIDIENYYDRLLTTFASNEIWSTGTLVAGGRAGGNVLRLTTASESTIVNNFAYYVNSDQFSLGVESSAATTIKVRFGLNATNYFEASVALAPGYQIKTWTKQSMTAVGLPSWNNISYFSLVVAGATVDFDSLRIQRNNILDESHVLVARKVYTTAFTKVAGSEKEMEYSLTIL